MPAKKKRNTNREKIQRLDDFEKATRKSRSARLERFAKFGVDACGAFTVVEQSSRLDRMTPRRRARGNRDLFGDRETLLISEAEIANEGP